MSIENGDMPAMPQHNTAAINPEGLTKREYATIHLAAAWVTALSARRGEPGYDDKGCAMHANSMACFQVDHLLDELTKKGAP